MARRMGNRMSKAWAGIVAVAEDLTADGTTLHGALNFESPSTILRCMGEYVIQPTSSVTAGDEVIIAVGLAVVSTDAVAAGAGSLPDPSAEPEYPWLYWASHPFIFNAAGVDRLTDPSAGRFSFDVRSRRRVKPRESLALIVEYGNVGTGGSPPITIASGNTRVLYAF